MKCHLKVHKCRNGNSAIYSSSYEEKYHADCALQHLSLFEIFALEICEMFVYKNTEKIEYVKN